MNNWPLTPSRVSSSPSAWSAVRMRAREKCFSGTVEYLARHEHSVARQRGRGVRERVRVEGRSARQEPPRLDEAPRSVDPRGGRDSALAGEELRDAGQRGIEAGVAGGRRLLVDERDLARTRGAPEVVGEAEQQPCRLALAAVPQVVRDRRRQFPQRGRAARWARGGRELHFVLTCLQ